MISQRGSGHRGQHSFIRTVIHHKERVVKKIISKYLRNVPFSWPFCMRK